MNVIHFQADRDLGRLDVYLRNLYFERRDAGSWLPERLHDMIYRVGALEMDEGRARSGDYLFLWEDNDEIVSCVLPDGENLYVSIKDGFEHLFSAMIAFSEKNCRPLFTPGKDASIKFWFAVSDRFAYMRSVLAGLGYREYPEKEYALSICPLSADVRVELPEGFRFLYGEDYPDESRKWSALRLGFHPEFDAQDYRASMNPYLSRKRSSLYPDSFECIVTDESTEQENNVCAYCFVYVDRPTKTARIEPVSTREAYRHKGIGTAMLHGAILRCKQLGVEACFVDAFGRRKDFYTAAGFSIEGSSSFWYKTLR